MRVELKTYRQRIWWAWGLFRMALMCLVPFTVILIFPEVDKK